MSTSTRGTAPGVIKLTAALHGFLAAYDLPDPAHVSLDLHDQHLRIQPAVAAWLDPVAVLSTLLLWTRGLSSVTAAWRRYSAGKEGDRVHVTIHGRLSSGVQVEVYRGMPYLAVCEWVCLDRNHEESVSLDELAWLVGELHTARPAA